VFRGAPGRSSLQPDHLDEQAGRVDGAHLRRQVTRLGELREAAVRRVHALQDEVRARRVGQVGNQLGDIGVAAAGTLEARLQARPVGQLLPVALAGLFRQQHQQAARGIDRLAGWLAFVLFYFDFFQMPVGDLHAFRLDLFSQNPDHTLLVVIRVLLFP
jgi:hypothetical protein